MGAAGQSTARQVTPIWQCRGDLKINRRSLREVALDGRQAVLKTVPWR